MTRVSTSWTMTPTYGDLNFGCVVASGPGSSLILAMAYQVLVAASVPALPLANEEFWMAMNAITQPIPHASRASAIHGLPVTPPRLPIVE
jgi:hypothetical protein